MCVCVCVRACVCACVCVCVNKTLCILAESESLTLIQKLARFSMKQAGKDYNPSAIHPQTGASIHPLTMSETSAMPSAASSCEKGCVGEGTRMNVTSSGTSTDAVHSLPAKTAEPDGGKEVQRGMWQWNGRGKGGTERYVTGMAGGKEVQRGMWRWNGRGKGGTERYVTGMAGGKEVQRGM